MKILLRLLFLWLPGLLLTVVLLIAGLLYAVGMLNQKGIEEAWNFGRSQGISALMAAAQVELFGVSAMSTDPSYGREQVEGRGYAPWVIRGNLDDQPRMISFALKPGLWAAWRTESATLYQLWRGDLGLYGAAYDYRHGPQPVSRGEWLLRNQQEARWFLRLDGEAVPALVRYLGHGYGPGRRTAYLRYELTASDTHLEIRETPEIDTVEGQTVLLRQFELLSPELQAGFSRDDGTIVWLEGPEAALRIPFGASTAIITEEQKRELKVADGVAGRGKQVIANSDCLSCHAEAHQVVGPSFARIAQRFLGKVQAGPLQSLTDSVINGGSGRWGQVPMTAHPNMSREDASAAVTYILSLGNLETELEHPLDERGQAYPFTRDYEVGDRLQKTHPAFVLDRLLPPGFEPKVGGLDVREDGKLVIASWDKDGAVFLLDPTAPMAQRVQRIAEGLHEPLGLRLVGDRLFVLQKQEVTELVDLDGDEIIDEYRNFSSDWPTTANFHSFAFGLVHKEDALYILLSICILPGGASCADQLPTQGKLMKISLVDGSVEIFASGFRTPNGIGLGPDGGIFVNDNQGDWLPSSKLLHVEQGKFYGSRAVPDAGVMAAEETPPVVWLPQDEIGNSPTEPFLLQEGPYSGQMIHGDVYHGGAKRVFMERVSGAWQGAVFRFSGGYMAGVNRFARGPDGEIYVGEIGNPPNWGQVEKKWFGLERMRYTGSPVHEIVQVVAQPDGFTLALGKALAEGIVLAPEDLVVRQWFYHPTEQYGGPKYDPMELSPKSLVLSEDRTQITAEIPGLKAGYVVYLRLDDRLVSRSGDSMWTHEAWYTLNQIPQTPTSVVVPPSGEPPANTLSEAERRQGWKLLFDGDNFGHWRNYGRPGKPQNWTVSEGALAFDPGALGPLGMIKSVLFGGGSGDLIYSAEKFQDFELSLQWKISENGNSGIFYFVADETQKTPWLTGLEMQVLDNEGHKDGRIHTHRAGDLYDLVAADPETVLPPGHWNSVRIRVKDNHIEHWLNGVKVLSIERFSEEWDELMAASKFVEMPDFGLAERGFIVLQDHGDPVWYRNIKVRSL